MPDWQSIPNPMETHVKVIGFILVTIGAIVSFIGLVALLALAGLFGATDSSLGHLFIGILAVVLLVAALVLGLPSLLVGIGLLRRRAWSRVGALAEAVVLLFGFPVGTAIGAYIIWVMSRPETPGYLDQR